MSLPPNTAPSLTAPTDRGPSRLWEAIRYAAVFMAVFLVGTWLNSASAKPVLGYLGAGNQALVYAILFAATLWLSYKLYRLWVFPRAPYSLTQPAGFLAVTIIAALVSYPVLQWAWAVFLVQAVVVYLGLRLFVFRYFNLQKNINQETLFMKFTKRDLLYSVITGLMTGLIVWRLLEFLQAPETLAKWGFGMDLVWLVLIVPVLWILGVNLGYFLGRWMGFFNQFGRFAAIGFTNASVDIGVLSLLIYITGINGGIVYALLKALSFMVATVNSYIFNKYWAFEDPSPINLKEVLSFFGISVGAIVINVVAATALVNFVDPMFGLSANAWAAMGAVVGSAASLIFSFVGFKKAVFNT